MLKELGWYLESGRFSSMAVELEGSLRTYAEAKQSGSEEEIQQRREETRVLYEGHCVRSGLRKEEESYLNIDAEFFNGDTLDEKAAGEFIKNIIKGHCYQKVLWTYMGTTGSFTVISKEEMKKQGLQYEDYLPIEYKKNRPQKKPLQERLKGAEIFYLYGDGTISREYNEEKAQLRFDRLQDKSGIDWRKGYDPNGAVKKDGWRGAFDRSGTWVRVDEQVHDNLQEHLSGAVTIELVKNGDSAILYDPGMLLLTAPALMYLTESGEPYGILSADKAKTVDEIKRQLDKMGASKIGAVGGIPADNPELIEEYKELLKGLAAPELTAVDHAAVSAAKAAREREETAAVAERSGVALERKLRMAERHGATGEAALAAAVGGSVTAPLTVGNTEDSVILGLSETEAREIKEMPMPLEHEARYTAALSNLYAAWPEYEASGLSKVDIARLVKTYFEDEAAEHKNVLPEIAAQTSLKEIILGREGTMREGVRLYASGIPGVFREPEAVDFYNGPAKEKYLNTLERKKILPTGGAAAALAMVQTLPAANDEQRIKLNKGLTRAFGQYKAVSMSTGLPLVELAAAVKAACGLEGAEGAAALAKKVHYELPAETLINAAGKENCQKKEVKLDAQEGMPVSISEGGQPETIIIGGVSGKGLDEAMLTREALITDYALSEEEAEKAQPFLHNIRFSATNPVMPLFLMEALRKGNPKTAGALRQAILGALEAKGEAAYNLSSSEGLEAYMHSGRAERHKVPKKEIQALLKETKPEHRNAEIIAPVVSKVELQYVDRGEIMPQNRVTPKGLPEQIRALPQGEERLMVPEAGAELRSSPGPETVLLVSGTSETGQSAAELGGFSEEALRTEYGYAPEEARETNTYLRGISIPKGKEGYFATELTPLFREILRGGRKAGEAQRRITETFWRRGDMAFNVASPMGMESYHSAGMGGGEINRYVQMMQGGRRGGYAADKGSSSEAYEVPVYARFMAMQKEPAGIETGGDGSVWASGLNHGETGGVFPQGDWSDITAGFASGDGAAAQPLKGGPVMLETVSVPLGTPVAESTTNEAGWAGSVTAAEGGRAGLKPPRQAARDTELERPWKKEANAGKGKAETAREGQPALAGLPQDGSAMLQTAGVPLGTPVAGSALSAAGEASGAGSVTSAEGGRAGLKLYHTPSAGAEFERLRKMEANYEKGKAEIVRTGQPALAGLPQNGPAMLQPAGVPLGAPAADNVLSAMNEAGGAGSVTAAESGRAGLKFPRQTARDMELERLRKMEANYEKDKAETARKKQPALARSESHDVGHAEGAIKEDEDLHKIARLQDKKIIKELRKRKGV